jgi:hypothetical protein
MSTWLAPSPSSTLCSSLSFLKAFPDTLVSGIMPCLSLTPYIPDSIPSAGFYFFPELCICQASTLPLSYTQAPALFFLSPTSRTSALHIYLHVIYLAQKCMHMHTHTLAYKSHESKDFILSMVVSQYIASIQ